MTAIRFIIGVFLLWGYGKAAHSQVSNQLMIHTDKSFYVTGELIWYKAYLPESFAGSDLALKMALVRSDGQAVEDYFIRTGGTTAVDGYFKLPYDLPSDMYHLLVLGTEREHKKRVKLGEAFIPIYNDLTGEEKNKTTAVASGAGSIRTGDLRVDVRLEPGPYEKRADIRAVVTVTDKSGNPAPAELSVSVTDAGLAGEDSGSLHSAGGSTGYQADQLEDQLYYNGYLMDENGRHRPNLPFAVYSIPEQSCFFSETDQNGAFALNLPAFKGGKAIQFVALQDDSLRVRLDDGVELARVPALQYTETVKDYLEWSRSRKLIYQLYNTIEAKLEVEDEPVNPRVYEPDHRVIFNQYASFPDLYTFFLEVSTPLKFRVDKESGYHAMMFNPDPRMRAFYQGAPVFIVDGKITRDVNFLQQIDIAKIDTLDQFFDFAKLSANFGKLGSSGVAIVKTSLPNLQLPASDEARIFKVSGILPEGRVIAPEKENRQEPNFRPQVYWSADQRADAQGKLRLSFPQSDDMGTFRIEVVARGREGEMGYGQQKYEVQW